ncbi:MAG: LppX_LprAFG lipoprotein [Chloroflexota bacterium]|nr:LppX_LprAFG lipoprotein [Chloroflexota bacterium]
MRIDNHDWELPSSVTETIGLERLVKRPLLFLLLFFLLALVGCGEELEEPVPTPTPSAEDWLGRAVEGWNEMESFHFALALEERTIELDEDGTLSIDEAEGDVMAPDRMQAETSVRTPFGSTMVAFIAIGDEQWLTNPLSGKWEEAPPDMRAEVTGLFDREAGIGAILADMENLERLADETVEERPTVHLRGTLPGALLTDFADDLPETVTVDLWIDEEEHHILKLVITEPATDEPEATWTFLFSGFNDTPVIEPPSRE